MWITQRRGSIDGSGIRRCRRHSAMGFSLVEVIIVSVVLTVLLATVWSLFMMQQRTLERGQRLSRNTRVVLALQRQMQEDLARVVLRRAEAIGPATRSIGNSSSLVSETSNFGLGPSLAGATGSRLAEATPVEFRLEGGSDWLIIDVRRPAYQWGAFDVVGLDPLSTSGESFGGGETSLGVSGNAAGLGGDDDPDQMPQRLPTAFQRIAYLWLTDEEITEVANLRYGHDSPTSGGSGVSNTGVGSSSDTSPMGGELANGTPSSGLRDRAMAGGAFRAGGGSDSGLTGGAGTDVNGGRRTLVRVAMDWSWPRESDLAGETWEDALSDAESTASEAMDFGVGLPGSSGSTTPQRRQWLRRLLAPASDPYRDFHLQSGSAIVPGTVAGDTGASDSLTELTSLEPRVGGSSVDVQDEPEYLLPNRRQPQVDWFPEVVAGKFQYFDGTRWQASFAEGEGSKLPWGVRFEYSVDARWFPVTVTDAVDSAQQGTDDSVAFSPLPMESVSAGAEAAVGDSTSLMTDLNRRPEFPHVVVYTFASRATRRDASLELDDAADSGEEPENASSDSLQSLGAGEASGRLPTAGSTGNSDMTGSTGGSRNAGSAGAANRRAPSSPALQRGF